ncbi:universal stress protein [uncultured Massilia sp.]|uniref:universal stress protein n=1 Tax=uncultured Massilia sp. TaxID=169973 RepID=UPI0025E29CBA|nr:universal stress protein [uncultured Massilia sp.]
MYKRILVPTDGTERGARALETALQLARLGGGRIIGLHACAPLILDPDGAMAGDPAQGNWRRERLQLAHDALAYVTRRAGEEGIPSATVLSRKDAPWEAIIDAARDHACDLIVMAAHGERSALARLLGSETQKVLTHSAIPVLVLR